MFGRFLGMPLVMAAGLGLVNPSMVQAHSYSHIDRLTMTLQRQTAELHREVHEHFRPTPFYKHLDEDVAAMERLARHIHDVAHHRGSISHLRRDVEKLDHLYHHVQSLLSKNRINFHAAKHFRAVMADIGSTLHHLRDDLNQMGNSHGHGRHGGIGFRVPIGGSAGYSFRFPFR